jgi:Uma2 family endonuclease
MNAPTRPLRFDNRSRRAKLTLEQFYAIDETGIFGDARTELIDGQIYVMNALHLPHARTKRDIEFALIGLLRGQPDLEVIGDVTVELDDYNGPQPDISILRRTDAQKGAPGEAMLIAIEVADSERRDLGLKRRLYARHGVPEYWVALVKSRTIRRFSDLRDGAYQSDDRFMFDQILPSATLPGVILPQDWCTH